LNVPVALYYILQLIYMGCSGESRREIAELLSQTAENDVGLIKDFLNILKSQTYMTAITHAIFIDTKYREQTHPHYNILMKKIGYIDYVDFNQLATIDKINTLFKSLIITPNDVDSTTPMIILNSVYFKEDWKHNFKQTEFKQPFTNLICNMSYVPAMSKKDTFDYYENEKLKIISIKCVNDIYAMDIFLPCGFGKINMEYVKQEFHNYDLDTLLTPQYVSCTIPLFTHRVHLNMAEILNSLGVKQIFEPELADFTNTGIKSLHIGKIIQEIVVVVDINTSEDKKEVKDKDKKAKSEIKKTFKVDHSFLYQIRNIKNGMIIVNGVYDG